jgi:hypothetical protein
MKHERTWNEPWASSPVNSSIAALPATGEQPRTTPAIDLTCPRCDALLVGIDSCQNPAAHAADARAATHARFGMYGAQLPPHRSAYPLDPDGHVLVPFRRHDGAVKYFPVLWRWVDPESGITFPWIIIFPILERPDLEYILGVSKSVFNSISANLPGRIPGRYTVAVRTAEFLKAYVFGDLVRKQWNRRTRSQTRRAHGPTCVPNCRKAHQ